MSSEEGSGDRPAGRRDDAAREPPRDEREAPRRETVRGARPGDRPDAGGPAGERGRAEGSPTPPDESDSAGRPDGPGRASDAPTFLGAGAREPGTTSPADPPATPADDATIVGGRADETDAGAATVDGADSESKDAKDMPTVTGVHVPRSRAAGRRGEQDRADKVVDRFRLLRRVGRGGMGEVWEAEQLEPVRRRVAYKAIRRGMDTDDVIARFESERQALALMDHPTIARVFDAGSTAGGRPYFVMEFIDGLPINEYCDEEELGIRERLDLFLQVCDGVQHAHHKAIIHRDLKPSNILVTHQDGRAVPKIIDFGIAKATEAPLTEGASETQLGTMVGTPEYMSPEQAEMGGVDLDTRTDVYSLGVVLYELLAGALPFDPDALRGGGIMGIVRTLREVEPPRPSVRISGLGDTTTEIAGRRRVEPGVLVRQLKGDLDWITLKALEKDRSRRYVSPNELAADIKRFLASEPVLASPPSTLYRARKFVARHRVGVGAASLVLALLIAFAATMTVQAGLIARERDRANLEAETARRVKDFLVGLFEVSDPSESLGNTITAREILDKGADRIRIELSDRPQIQAELMDTIGWVYRSLGLYEDARPLLLASVSVLESRLGPQHEELAGPLEHLGTLMVRTGEYAQASAYFERALEIREKTYGPQHRSVGSVLQNMGTLALATGEFELAEQHYVRALTILEGDAEVEETNLAHLLSNLATLYRRTERPDEALTMYRQSLEILERTRGPDHPDVGQALNSLASLLRSTGKIREALALYDRSLAIREATLGPDHPDLARSLNNLGVLHLTEGELDKAERLNRRALEIRERAFGPDHTDVAQSLTNLALVLKARGAPIKAVPLLERSLAIWDASLGSGHPLVAIAHYNLAATLAVAGRRESALAELRRALDGGFNNPVIRDDKDFASLAGDPSFESIVAEVERRAETQ